MGERRRIIEGKWTCSSCDTEDILGRHKVCPVCGNPRDSEGNETDFDYGAKSESGANAAETVADSEALALARAGADWFCGRCGAANKGTAEQCEACGASRDTALPPPEDSEPEAVEDDEPLPPRRRGLGAGVGTMFASLASCCGCFGWWATGTHEVEATVTQARWEHVLTVERFTPTVATGWRSELRESTTVLPTSGQGERAGVSNVRDCTRKQKGTRRVADGTRRVCETKKRDVACGTEEKCTTKDMGNGFAEEVCRDVTKYCSEEYEDCNDETQYRQEPVYGEECQYDTYSWKAIDTRTASGNGADTNWPEVSLQTLDRENREASYTVVLEYDDGGPQLHTFEPQTTAEFQRWDIGTTTPLSISNMGTVTLGESAP